MSREHPWPKYEILRDVTRKRILFYKPNEHKLCNPAKKSRKAEIILLTLFIWQVKIKGPREGKGNCPRRHSNSEAELTLESESSENTLRHGDSINEKCVGSIIMLIITYGNNLTEFLANSSY